MAFGSTTPLKTWGPVVLACALGCATGTQNEGLGSFGIDTGGSDMGGSTTDMSGSGGMAEPMAGNTSTGGMGGAGNTSVGGTPTAGTFTTSGTAGVPATAGTFSVGGMAGNGGAGGKASGGGGSGGASGGKGGGGAGGSVAGAGGKGGSGGTGGSPAVGCAANPIPTKTMWIASAAREAGPCPGVPNADYCGPAARAIDGLTAPANMTRYTTGAPGTATDWLQIDFGTTVTVSKVVLNSAAANDATQGYALRMSAAAGTIAASTPITSGTGTGVTTTITFPATTGQFLRISLTTPTTGWWSIQELDASCQ